MMPTLIKLAPVRSCVRIELNVALIANKFRAAGQVCVCANRVFVHRSVIDKFANVMKQKISQLKFGHGLEKGITNGPLTTKRGAERCVELVDDAVQHGAKLILGGKRFGDGYHFEPTLLVGAAQRARVYKEEMFSPICSLYPFDNEDEVIDLCNDTPMGLTNYVFTQNLARAFRCSDRLQSGTVSINTANANSAESPFGGIKESGLGKEGGLGYGVEEFCVLKTTAVTLA